jgi:hypothetical protein
MDYTLATFLSKVYIESNKQYIFHMLPQPFSFSPLLTEINYKMSYN